MAIVISVAWRSCMVCMPRKKEREKNVAMTCNGYWHWHWHWYRSVPGCVLFSPLYRSDPNPWVEGDGIFLTRGGVKSPIYAVPRMHVTQ